MLTFLGRARSGTKRSRKKAEAKKATGGHKGTVYEETYLLNSIKRSLDDRLATLQSEAAAFLPVLMTLGTSSRAHRTAASELQGTLSALEKRIADEVLPHVWHWREREWAAEKADDDRKRDRGEPVPPRNVPDEPERARVERPKLPSTRWQLSILRT